MESEKWLAINYNLPSEPSRIRVAAWRSMKKLGAVNIQQSMWVLPFNEANYGSLLEVVAELEKNGGEVLLMESVFLREDDEKKVILSFNKARNEEYQELIEQCSDFFKEIEKETARKNFSYAEIEENEEELEKLLSWRQKIKLRDIFQASLGETAEAKLEECKKLLEEFNGRVFEFINGRED